MFPREIKRIAEVAIQNSEWHVVDYLVDELYGWMECPDAEAGMCAAYMGKQINAKLDDMESSDYAMYSKYVRIAYRLYTYAVASLIPQNA